MDTFYDIYCKKHTDDTVLYPSFNGLLEIDKKNKSRQRSSLNLLVRLLSVYTDINKLKIKHTSQQEDENDFDNFLLSFETPDSKEYEISIDNFELYFLPSNLENTLKNITQNKSRKKPVDYLLKDYISEDIINQLNLRFTVEPDRNNIISLEETRTRKYSNGKYATSFFKFYNSNSIDEKEQEQKITECTFEEIQENINCLKHEINAEKMKNFDKYCVGKVPEGFGFFEENFSCTFPRPLTYHYNFWKFHDDNSANFKEISTHFKAYRFKEEIG